MDFIDAHHHTWDHRVFPYPGVNDPHPIGDISHFKENYLIKNLNQKLFELTGRNILCLQIIFTGFAGYSIHGTRVKVIYMFGPMIA